MGRSGRRVLLVAGTSENGEGRVLRETRIGLRKLAQQELRALGGLYGASVGAVGAQTERVRASRGRHRETITQGEAARGVAREMRNNSIGLRRFGGRRLCRGCRRSWRVRLSETRFVNGDIYLDFIGGDSLGVFAAHCCGFNQKWIFEAVDFAEVPEERDPGNVFVTKLAIALPFQNKMRGGVEKEITDFAIAVGELDLVSGFPLNILFAG